MRSLAIVASTFAGATAVALGCSTAYWSLGFAPKGVVSAGVLALVELVVAFVPTRSRYLVTGVVGAVVLGLLTIALWLWAAIASLLVDRTHPELPFDHAFWVAVVTATIAAPLALTMALRADRVSATARART